MKLTAEVKQLIRKEFESFEEYMYAGKSKTERDELAQFFTPPEVSIRLLEAYDTDTLAGKIIRDPTSGSGNLLAAALIAGADSDKIFGNEYDPVMVKWCRARLNRVCDMLDKPHIQDWQVHRGDALIPVCLKTFGPEYKQKLTNYYLYEMSDQYALFPMLTPEQEAFLSEVD